jgi:hypothetical protein
MGTETRDDVEIVGQRLLTKLFHRLDGNDYAGVTSLFHPDGVWLRRGKELAGAAAIIAALSDRSPTLVGHHVVTNILVEPVDQARATVLAYLTVYRHDSGTARQGPAPLSGPAAIALCRGELAHRDGAWKLSRLVVEAPTMSADIKA